jgi:hypothetical protein
VLHLWIVRGRTIWIVDAHREDGQRFVARAEVSFSLARTWTIFENQTVSEPLKVFEASGIEPVLLTQEQAIDYAACRACFRLAGFGFWALGSSAVRVPRMAKQIG